MSPMSIGSAMPINEGGVFPWIPAGKSVPLRMLEKAFSHASNSGPVGDSPGYGGSFLPLSDFPLSVMVPAISRVLCNEVPYIGIEPLPDVGPSPTAANAYLLALSR